MLLCEAGDAREIKMLLNDFSSELHAAATAAAAADSRCRVSHVVNLFTTPVNYAMLPLQTEHK